MKTVLTRLTAVWIVLMPIAAWAQEEPAPPAPAAPADAGPARQVAPERQQQLERLFQQLQKAYEARDFERMERLLGRMSRPQPPAARPDAARPMEQSGRRLRERSFAPQEGSRQERPAARNRFARPYGRFRQGQGQDFRPMDIPGRMQQRPFGPYTGPRQNRWAGRNQFARPYNRFRRGQGWNVRPMDAPNLRADRGRPFASPQGRPWWGPNRPSRPRWNPNSFDWNRSGRFFRQGPASDFWADEKPKQKHLLHLFEARCTLRRAFFLS